MLLHHVPLAPLATLALHATRFQKPLYTCHFSSGTAATQDLLYPSSLFSTTRSRSTSSSSATIIGSEVVTRLCQRLLDGGAPGLHFYTLNQATPALRVLDNLRCDT